MANKNGYFQLDIGNDCTCVKLFPPISGGEPISVEELRDYLVTKGLNPDIVLLKHEIDNLTAPKLVIVSNKKTYPVPESFNLKVSEDKMTAIARFYPFSSAAPALTREDILKELDFRGIKYGICEDMISSFLSDKQYCTDYLIAIGSKPKQGADSSIKYCFNTDPNLKPKLNEDGSVDFFSLAAISKVSAGDVLAVLTKEIPGEDGYTVYGDVLPARAVKRGTLKYGRNIEVSEDGLKLISSVNGHASLVEDKVFVSDIYEVVDVDTSTGNIDYKGDVLVTGNVKAGYTVIAEGNVEVKGVVEGAIIKATGDVTIARGMNGMGKGIIEAGGNVVSKFIENATVSAQGYVHSEAIMHSKISAKGDITVTGRKGFITGGAVRALGTVSAKIIGSTMGVDTEVEVGTDPTLALRNKSIVQEIEAVTKKIKQVEPVIVTLTQKIKQGQQLTMDQLRYFKQLSEEYKQAREDLAKLNDEYMDLQDKLEDMPVESVVKVSDFAYPGTKITISGVYTVLSKPTQHARFVRDGADIRVKAL